MGKNNKKSIDVIAVIDIGSDALRLKIAEDRHQMVHVLEYLEYPLRLGSDTYTKGKISFEKVDKICEIIKNFLFVAASYDIKVIRAVATTAVREASNKDYIIDQVKIKTGVSVDIMDDSEEKLYIYKEICKKLLLHWRLQNEPALLVYIGSGSLGISIYKGGNIIFTQNIQMGSLRLSELLGTVQEQSEKFYIVVEQYVKSFTSIAKKIFPMEDISHFIATGREIEIISNFCKSERQGEFVSIPKDTFVGLYEMIKHKTPTQLMDLYKISEEKAEVLLPSMSIYETLLSFTSAQEIMAPQVFLSDALLSDMLYEEQAVEWNKVFAKNTILSAKNIAARYQYDAKHAQMVENHALKIFDKMKKIHGLGSREKLLLQTAAVLHDIGKYINSKNHYRHSYEIIRASDILGLSEEEIEIVANIAKYHSGILPKLEQASYRHLSPKERVLVSKLSAILRIADALDRSHLQKFEEIEVKLKEDKLQITVETYKDTMLEEWCFGYKSEFFEEVFGLKAYMKKKKVM
jgi:exopolyphosphatase/guanosine-5'-triphosphate,3'-diphosphate pyrophosphatase